MTFLEQQELLERAEKLIEDAEYYSDKSFKYFPPGESFDLIKELTQFLRNDVNKKKQAGYWDYSTG